MTTKLTEQPKGLKKGLLGIPYRLPYYPIEFNNDQSLAPDLHRQNAHDRAWHEPRTIKHFDWDLGGDLLNGSNIRVVDYGNVTLDIRNLREHYNRAEKDVKKIFESAKTLVTIGGDHGITIPIFKRLPKKQKVTLV